MHALLAGFGNNNVVLKICEKFNLAKGTWQNIASMTYPRAYSTAVTYGDNYIFLIGGFIGDKLDGVNLNLCLKNKL